MAGSIRIGVLAFQGAFAEHEYCLKRAASFLKDEGCEKEIEVTEVRKPSDVDSLQGLVIPGGESTTMAHYLRRNGFLEKIATWMTGTGRKPIVWGTCAGLILLADNVRGKKTGGQISLGGMNITADRNTFGRQRESFEQDIHLLSHTLQGTGPPNFHGIFIRAPGVYSVDSDDVEVLATVNVNGNNMPIAVQQGNLMATSFHPELTEDFRWHSYFINQVIGNND